MVAKIDSVRSIKDVLLYNEGKIKKADAKLLFAAGFPWGVDTIRFDCELEVFNKLLRQNLRSKKNSLHITLNFSSKDNLDEGKLIKIANDYLTKLGLASQPYLIYQHFDAGHPHLHIATVCIADGGKKINTFQYKGGCSFHASNELEEIYGLTRAMGQNKEMSEQLKAVRLERVVYGKVEVGNAIGAVVGEVLHSYKCCSLPDFNLVLNQFGIRVDPGRRGSRMYNGRGLLYMVLDEDDNKVGVPVKASNIYGKPTLLHLEKRFASNLSRCEPNKRRLRFWLDKALSSADRVEAEKLLSRNGIRIIFRKDPTANCIGITIIDNAARAVFNHEVLGEKYGVQAFLKLAGLGAGGSQLKEVAPALDRSVAQDHSGDLVDNSNNDKNGRENDIENSLENAIGSESAPNKFPGSELPVFQTFTDRLYYDYEEQEDSYIAIARRHKQKGVKNKQIHMGLSL